MAASKKEIMELENLFGKPVNADRHNQYWNNWVKENSQWLPDGYKMKDCTQEELDSIIYA